MINIQELQRRIDSIMGEGYFSAQLAKGIEVEQEHTKDMPVKLRRQVAAKIALDHIAGEFPDYYERLEVMEREGKAAWRNWR